MSLCSCGCGCVCGRGDGLEEVEGGGESPEAVVANAANQLIRHLTGPPVERCRYGEASEEERTREEAAEGELGGERSRGQEAARREEREEERREQWQQQ